MGVYACPLDHYVSQVFGDCGVVTAKNSKERLV